MHYDFNAKEEIQPRISRLARIRKYYFSIREIRGKKSFRQIHFAPLRLCVFALKTCCIVAGKAQASAKACAMRNFWSRLWMRAEPVAGLAEAGRRMPAKGNLPKSISPK